jgi:hypothetical protein
MNASLLFSGEKNSIKVKENIQESKENFNATPLSLSHVR